MSESKSLLVTVMNWRISGQGYKQFTRFSRFVLFKPAASTMQKINLTLSAVLIFVSKGLFIYIYFLLFEENHQTRISRVGEKNFSNNFALFS